MNSTYRNYVRLLWGLIAVCLVMTAYPAAALAEYPYATNYRTQQGELIWTQAAFAPERVLGKDILIPHPEQPEQLISSPLMQPRDLFIDHEDRIYVADSGNNRIVVFRPDGQFQRIIMPQESPLSNPQGIYADLEGQLYVADTGNSRVVKLDQEGRLLQEYKLPDSNFIPEGYRFEPIKLVVDKRGFLYIVSLGSYSGLMQLDADGQFVRFFAANKAPFTVLDSIKRMIYTREMYEKQLAKLPPAINNVNIDDRGFIYTVSYGEFLESEQVKKLNSAGKNFLGAGNNLGLESKSYGEQRFSRLAQTVNLKDVAVDSRGNFSVIDADLKMVSQYDAYGNLLFFWSGDASPVTTQLGIVQSPAAIDVNSRGELFILDDNANLMQMFRQTEFGALVYEANNLTLDGKYEAAEPLWREVLHRNAYYTPAILGLAQAAYGRGDYLTAQKLFLEGGVQEGYSNAFWQIRLKWFQQRFGLFMNFIIGFGLLAIISKQLPERYRLRLGFNRGKSASGFMAQLKHGLYLLRHPIDGFYALRYEHKGGYRSAFVILVLSCASFAVVRLFTSFTFNLDAIRSVSVLTIVLQFMIAWTGWVVSNYLVSSIMRGEGRFKDVFVGSAYAMLPFIVIGLPLTLLSKVMTLSEASIYSFLYNGMIVWTALLLIWMVQSVQNYSTGETAMNLLYTAGTMIVIGVLCFIIFGLSAELRNFMYSIVQEVSVR